MNDLASIHIAAWLGCAAFLVVLTNGVLHLVDRMKGNPPGEVIEAGQTHIAARLTALEENAREGFGRRLQIKADIDAAKEDARRGDEKVRQEINGTLKEIFDQLRDFTASTASLQTDSQRQNETLAAIMEKIDRLQPTRR